MQLHTCAYYNKLKPLKLGRPHFTRNLCRLILKKWFLKCRTPLYLKTVSHLSSAFDDACSFDNFQKSPSLLLTWNVSEECFTSRLKTFTLQIDAPKIFNSQRNEMFR